MISTYDQRLYHTPLGLSTKRPAVELPPIGRKALMQNAHRIARDFRPHFKSYREALAYGLRTAWQQVNVARSIIMLNAQVTPRACTTTEWAASKRATRRCGSSFVYA
jgi:hypothetical protein